VLDPNGGPKPALAKDELAVLDPAGTVKARLQARGVAFTEAATVDELSAKAKVIVIGKDALTRTQATDTKWLGWRRGARACWCWSSKNPLHYLATPADLVPTTNTGRIAFAENLEHPVFDGLAQQDFFTWSKDHVVYRNVYRKATRGPSRWPIAMNNSAVPRSRNARPMTACCSCASLSWARTGLRSRGSAPLRQHAGYCATYAPVRKNTALVMDLATPAGKLLAESGLKCDKLDGLLPALSDGKHQIVVFEANPTNLKTLAETAAAVKTFTDAGGWLLPGESLQKACRPSTNW